MPSKKVLEQKQKQVINLAEKFKKAKIIILSKYSGINVEDDTKLRNDIKKSGNEYLVVKNSIISHALDEAKLEGIDQSVLQGPTSITIGYDNFIDAAKTVEDYAKDHDFYVVKAGALDGKIVSVDQIKKLASLPSKQTLYTMVATALLSNIRNLAIVLDQTRQKKEAVSA